MMHWGIQQNRPPSWLKKTNNQQPLQKTSTINSFRPDWCHRGSWWTLVQVMACCHEDKPLDYLNQSLLITNQTFRNTLQWNFILNCNIFISENAFKKLFARCQPFCSGLNVLKRQAVPHPWRQTRNSALPLVTEVWSTLLITIISPISYQWRNDSFVLAHGENASPLSQFHQKILNSKAVSVSINF